MPTAVKKYQVLIVAGLAALLVGVTALVWLTSRPATSVAPAPLPEPEFIGRTACAACHEQQNRLWQGSHHDLAMQEANETTVLGDFNGAEFRKDGVTSRFFQRDGSFWVRTDGPDGQLADFEVKYAFGFTPLQQYLLELPGGRLQALSIAWDSRPKPQGGQRWFHLYPNERIDHNDELHWTKLSQNWNFMCAECHSTNLRKNYDSASHRYRTVWSEIDVACEACHGPGSRHAAWARRAPGSERSIAGDKGLLVLLDERRDIRWSLDPSTGNARRSAVRSTDKELQTCARCHARRAPMFADYRSGRPLLDTHLPALLEPNLYYADGQIEGEVYEYGSFLQSRMHQAGVTCSDCHEPHSLKLRAAGDEVCRQCHRPETYAAPDHHFHPQGGAGCIDCHMPPKTYMGVDARRDHGFRNPRPDISAKLGTPNPCTGCHAGKSAHWAANTVRQWYGHDPQGYQNYAETFAAARIGAAGTEIALTALLEARNRPAIARATAAAELGLRLKPESVAPLAAAVSDADPQVRVAAAEALAQLPPEPRWRYLHPALNDPLRVVRALAAGALAEIPPDRLPASEQADLLRATDEYLATQLFNADTPAAQVNLGNFHAARGDTAVAEQAYREALRLDTNWLPAYANLADLYRQTGRDDEGATVLQQGLARQPQAATLHHALGLLEVRRNNLPAALAALKRAVDLAPQEPRFSYVYAVALHSAGRAREARQVVEAGLKRAPEDPLLIALLPQLAASARSR